MLDKQAILSAHVMAGAKEIYIDALGGKVKIAPLTGRQLSEFQKYVKQQGEDSVLASVFLANRSLVDDEGRRVFTDKELDLMSESLSVQALTQIAAAVTELNKFGDGDEGEDGDGPLDRDSD